MSAEWAGVITAVISGFCVAVPTIVATVTSNRAHDKVVEERMRYMGEQIKDLNAKVEKYSEFNERLIVIDADVKRAHTRIDDLKIQVEERRELK